MRSFAFWRWAVLATLLSTAHGDSLDFGRALAVSLTRTLSSSVPVTHMPQASRGAYTGAASVPVTQGLALQTCVASTASDCASGRAQASPVIFVLPSAYPSLSDGSSLVVVYVLLQPAFGLPAVGVQSSYSLDLQLLSQGAAVDSRSLKPVPMVAQMTFKSSDCPRSHVAMGLSGDCSVACMMYDARLEKWSPIGITTGRVGDGVVNCSLSTLPANILVSQFLTAIRIALVGDKSANAVQNFFNGSLITALVRWTGATAANFQLEALRPFSASRLDMTRVFLVVTSTSIDPENIFQAIKRLPEGGRVMADPSSGWTQGPLTILMVEKYYTQIPVVTDDTPGAAKCFAQADCPLGLYCDEFSNCFSCGPGSVGPGYCDSITYDCCAPDFRKQCSNNPYNCSDSSQPASPPTFSASSLPPSRSRGRSTTSPSVSSPAPTQLPSAVANSSAPPTSFSPPPTPAVPSVVVSRPSKNGTLFRIISLQDGVVPMNASLLGAVDAALSTVDSDPATSVSAVSLRSQGTTLTTVGEIVTKKPVLDVYDALVRQGSSPASRLRSEPLFSHIASISMLCAYGLWRPRCSHDTLEGSLNATLMIPNTTIPPSSSAIVANLEAASGTSDRFVVTGLQQQPNGTFANFSIVPSEQGEPSSQSIYDTLSRRLPQSKTIVVLMNFSSLDPDELPGVQSALCALSNSALGITLTRDDLCNNITLSNGPQQQWMFTGPITTPLTSAMIIDDNRTFEALQHANNGTGLNQSDIVVLIFDSPIVPQVQACPVPLVRLASGVCSSPQGVTLPAQEGLSTLAKILIGVFVGLALLLLLCLCFCCWKRLFCFKKKDKKEPPQEPVTSITFVDSVTPKKPEEVAADPIVINNDNHKNKPVQHPEISPLHKSSFSHRPISLDEHEGVSRNGFEYDSHSSDEYPDTEKRSFHFRLETKPTPPAITPMQLHSPSSGSSEVVLDGASPIPPFMSLRTPIPQRRVPPQPRTQPIFPSPIPPSSIPLSTIHARKESLDAKHNEPVQRTMSTPKHGLQPSQRQTIQSAQRLHSTPYQAPRQNTPSQPPRQNTPSQPRFGTFPELPDNFHGQRRAAEQTPISSAAFSTPQTDTDGDDEEGSNTTFEGEYSDENTTRYGRRRGTPLDESRGLIRSP